MKKFFKSDRQLSDEELYPALGLSKESVKSIYEYNFYDAALDNFKEYQYSLYEVTLN